MSFTGGFRPRGQVSFRQEMEAKVSRQLRAAFPEADESVSGPNTKRPVGLVGPGWLGKTKRVLVFKGLFQIGSPELLRQWRLSLMV